MDKIDTSILKKYTVDELDMLHDLAGLGPDWKKSEVRATLVAAEELEQDLIAGIIDGRKVDE